MLLINLVYPPIIWSKNARELSDNTQLITNLANNLINELSKSIIIKLGIVLLRNGFLTYSILILLVT
jgi:hypothetical protein